MKILSSYFIVFSLFFANLSLAQATTIPVKIFNPDTIRGCTEKLFHARIFASSGSKNLTIHGYVDTFTNQTSCGTSSSGVFIKVDTTGLGFTNVSTDTITGTWSGDYTNTDTINFDYRIFVDCSIIKQNSNNQSHALVQTWTNTSSSGLGYDLDSTASNTLTLPLILPYLSFTNQTNIFSGAYLETTAIDFTFKNTGNSFANILFQFNQDTTAQCHQIHNDSLKYSIGNSGIFQTLFSDSLTEALIPIDSTLIIRQYAIVDACISDGSCSPFVNFNWQCNFRPQSFRQTCTKCLGSQQIFYRVENNDNLKLKLERIFPDSITTQWDHSCPNDTSGMVFWQYRITNVGNGAIDSLTLRLFSNDNEQELTLIPRSTLQIDSSHCKLDSTKITTRNHYLCSNLFPNTLDDFNIYASNFSKNDTLIFSFRTYRCIEESDIFLLNKKKKFNQWSINLTGVNECDKNNVQNVDNNLQPILSTVGISSNGYDGDKDVNQLLEFIPTVTDLSVPKGVPFGDSARMHVNLAGIIQEPHDYQLLGCSDINTSNCSLKGYLKVVIHCDKGLIVSDSSTNVLWKLFNDSTGSYTYFHPKYYYTNVPMNFCDSGSYIYYFDLADTNSLNLLNRGTLDFTLQSCCGLLTSCTCDTLKGKTPYNVRFYLLPNPSGTCTSLTFNDTTHRNPPTCVGNTCTWLPLSSIEGKIAVHCPGCKAPGIVAENYKIRRISFGLQDSNNNDLADTSKTVIDPNSAWYQQYQEHLRQQYSTVGDHVEDLLIARFQDGEIDSGYTYSQMMQANVSARLNELQLLRNIPYGLNVMKLLPSSFNFYIDTLVQVNDTNCIDCNHFENTSRFWRTQLKINVKGQDIFTYFLDTSITANKYLFSFESRDSSGFSVGNLHKNLSGTVRDTLFPFNGFYPTQRYRLQVNYNVTGNFFGVYPAFNFSDVAKNSDISNTMWLSGKKQNLDADLLLHQMPNTISALDSNQYTIDPADSLNMLVDSSFVNKFRFYCETFGGTHVFISQLVSDNTSISKFEGGDCKKLLNVNFATYTASNFKDVFPYEYRPPSLFAKYYEITIPEGYSIESAKANVRLRIPRTSNATNTVASIALDTSLFKYLSVNPSAPLDTHYSLVDSVLPTMTCMDESFNLQTLGTDSTPYLGSGEAGRFLSIYLKPNNCLAPTFNPKNDTTYYFYDIAKYQCLPASNVKIIPPYTSSYIDEITKIPLSNSAIVNLKSTLPGDTAIAFSNKLCFPIKIENIDSLADAPNVFIQVPTYINWLNNWSFTTNGLHDSIVNNILHVSNLLIAQTKISGNLCANFISCPDTNPGSSDIVLKYGWNCTSFPISDSLLNQSCFIDSITLHVKKSIVQVESNGKNAFQLRYSLCSPIELDATFKSSGNGVAYPYELHVDSLVGLSIDSVFIRTCLTSNPVVKLNRIPQTNKWIIDSLNLADIKLKDTIFHNGACIQTSVYCTTLCAFTGDSLPNITLLSKSYCNDLLSTNAIFNNNYPLVWDSTSKCGYCFTIDKSISSDPVYAGDTVTYTIIACSKGNLPRLLTMKEILPFDFTPIGSIPITITLRPLQCDTFTLRGYFNTAGPATDSAGHINRVKLQESFGYVWVQDSVGVQVIDDCINNADFVFSNNDSTTNGYNSDYSGATIYVAGIFTVNSNMIFNNCTINMAAGAQIIVADGIQLNLAQTTIQGCRFMWRGITMKYDSRISLSEQSILRDANEGISVGLKSSLNVENSYFEDCVRGIICPTIKNVAMNHCSISVIGTKFAMVATNFKLDYNKQPGHGKTPYCGIELQNTQATIGGDVKNIFDHLNNGIVSNKSLVEVVNAEFKNIQIDTSQYYLSKYIKPQGFAIVGMGDLTLRRANYLTVSDINYPLTIDSSNGGIFTYYSTLDARYMNIDHVKYGIQSSYCSDGLFTNVLSSFITASKFGIRWYYNGGSSGMLARENTINIQGDTLGVGISIYENSYSKTTNYEISQYNTLNIHNARFGVRMNIAHNARVYNNYINLIEDAGTTPNMTAIALSACDSSVINSNTIQGHKSTSGNRIGIFSNQSFFTNVSCNRIDSTGIGFFFGGQLGKSDFKGNVMNDLFTGVYLNSVAVIDTQKHSGNQWQGSYNSRYGAVNFNDSSLQKLKLSLFIYQPNSYLLPNLPNGSGLLPYGKRKNIGWFKQDLLGPTYYCPNSADPNMIDPTLPIGLADLIASDSTLTSDFISESKVTARQYLYLELLAHPDLLNNSSLYQTFMDENKAIEYLNKANDELASSADWDSLTFASLVNSDSLINMLKDSIGHIDELLRIDTLTNYEPQREIILTLLNSIIDTKSILVIQHYTSNEQNLSNADSLNNNVVANEIPLYNERFMNEVENNFEHYGDSVLTGYYASILDIATQCPYKGGRAVFKARFYVHLFNDSIVYFDDEVCLSQGVERLKHDELNSTVDFMLTPNPANEQVEVRILNHISDDLSIQLINSYGEILLEKGNERGVNNLILNTKSYPSGFYQVRLYRNGISVQTEKLILIK